MKKQNKNKKNHQISLYITPKGQAVCEGCKKWRGSNQSSSLALGGLTEYVAASNETAHYRGSCFGCVMAQRPQAALTTLPYSSPLIHNTHVIIALVWRQPFEFWHCCYFRVSLKVSGMGLLVQSDSADVPSVPTYNQMLLLNANVSPHAS